MTPARPRRSRRFRIVRALLVGAAALALLYAWDGSRQPVSGNGWSLLAAQRAVGEVNTVALLTGQPALAAAWEALRAPGEPPQVDFGRVVVAWFVDAGTVACRSRLDGIHVDRDTRIVAASLSRGLVWGCDDGVIADSFLVAIDRAKLPPAPWTLALRDPLPSGAPGARLDVPQ